MTEGQERRLLRGGVLERVPRLVDIRLRSR
jgi:hypothetical protein